MSRTIHGLKTSTPGWNTEHTFPCQHVSEKMVITKIKDPSGTEKMKNAMNLGRRVWSDGKQTVFLGD